MGVVRRFFARRRYRRFMERQRERIARGEPMVAYTSVIRIPAISGATLEAKPLTEKEGFEPSNESLAHE